MVHSVPMCILTVDDGEQCAVRCVHVACCHVVPLIRPINGGIVLDIKLLGNKEQDNIWFKVLLPVHGLKVDHAKGRFHPWIIFH